MSVMVAEAARVAGAAEGTVGIGRRNGAMRLVATGGAAILLATAGLGAGALLHDRAPSTRTAPIPTAAEATPSPEIVVEMSYAPGESSGWHLHPVNHTVQVLSGTLAVYDGSCRARFYGAGETYVGGTHAHLVRNEGGVPVQMVVATSEPAVAADSVTHLAAPAGCPAA